MRRGVKRALGAGLVGAGAYAMWRASSTRRSPVGLQWEARAFPFPPEPVSAWVDAHDDGSCPVSHPVKVKLSSGIFHVPGGSSYTRTRADRCYVSAEAASSQGLRAAKR